MGSGSLDKVRTIAVDSIERFQESLRFVRCEPNAPTPAFEKVDVRVCDELGWACAGKIGGDLFDRNACEHFFGAIFRGIDFEKDGIPASLKLDFLGSKMPG